MFSADGVFIIRLLSKNTSSIFISDILSELYELYKENMIKIRSKHDLQMGSFTPNDEDNETGHWRLFGPEKKSQN